MTTSHWARAASHAAKHADALSRGAGRAADLAGQAGRPNHAADLLVSASRLRSLGAAASLASSSGPSGGLGAAALLAASALVPDSTSWIRNADGTKVGASAHYNVPLTRIAMRLEVAARRRFLTVRRVDRDASAPSQAPAYAQRVVSLSGGRLRAAGSHAPARA